jgi:thioredoxin reductase (NADPH)
MDSGPGHHEVVVIGGGAAGVSAALECVDMKLDTVLLEAGRALGGQLAEIFHSVRNVASGWYADGAALQAGLQRSAETLGSRVLLGHPVSTAAVADGWVEANGRRFHGQAILIATGSTPQRLPAAPDGAFGGDITYQLSDPPPERFAGRPVAVVGGGDSATLDALGLAETASSVLLLHRHEGLTARHDIVAQVEAQPKIKDLPGWEVASAHGDQRLEKLELVRPATGDRQTVAAAGLVVKVSRDPATEAFRGELELDGRGFVVADGDLRTSRPGVFATGDVVAGAYWRVAYALGQGVLAARSIRRYLEASR